MDYLSVEDAIDTPGLRLVLTAGVPGPWGEAAKYFLDYKGLAYAPVYQEGGGENAALHAWTGQNSAPVLVYEGLPPISHWLDLLMFIERHAPEPVLVPADPAQRARVLGLASLIAGVDGLGWNRRLQMFAPLIGIDNPPEAFARMGRKYGWSEAAHDAAADKILAILTELEAQLKGGDYFMGDTVTAVDFYWASFSAMFKPLPQEINPMPDFLRQTYETAPRAVIDAFSPALEAHRDRMFERHIATPLDY